MKKIWIILCGVLAVLMVTLTACGQQQSSSSKSNNSEYSASKPANNNQQSSNGQQATNNGALWNNKKSQQLDQFINQWAPTMNQSYEKYNGTDELKVSTGLSYPADLSKEQVDGQAGLLGWAPSGKGNYEYNVVAIYNYNGTEPPLPNRITYFFCFHNGKPVVLVDQSRDGDPSAHPTVNKDVESNFERIANEN